uniref:SSGP-11C2 n=1 Tax=Mayetiola destructor TaxID=39758 RepID=A0PGP4_MAYDE|nr:SSGP-11C2 [Mayetiola destructor]
MQKATIFVLLAVIAVASAEFEKHEKPPQRKVGLSVVLESDPTGVASKRILERNSSLRLLHEIAKNGKSKSLTEEPAPQVHSPPSVVKSIVSQYERQISSIGAQRPMQSPKLGRKIKT